MEKRIFGLLPVVDRDGVPIPSVTRMEVTGADLWLGDMMQSHVDCIGCLDAVEFVPGGSVLVGPKGCGMQHAVCRDGWQ